MTNHSSVFWCWPITAQYFDVLNHSSVFRCVDQSKLSVLMCWPITSQYSDVLTNHISVFWCVDQSQLSVLMCWPITAQYSDVMTNHVSGENSCARLRSRTESMRDTWERVWADWDQVREHCPPPVSWLGTVGTGAAGAVVTTGQSQCHQSTVDRSTGAAVNTAMWAVEYFSWLYY